MAQFSLKQLLLAMAFAACACAVAGWLYRRLMDLPITEDEFAVALLTIGGFSGAAIGAITNRVWKWAAWGVVVGLVALCFVFSPLFQVATE